MAALDLLPPSIRNAVMYSPAQHSPAAILRTLRSGQVCECLVLRAIELKNDEMCAAYRRSMAAGGF